MAQMSNKDLIGRALGVCHTLTYNEEPQGSAKHTLRELAHRLDRARTLDADQVAGVIAAIYRHLPPANAPRISRTRDLQAYALLYELMEVAGLEFSDDAAALNGTPTDVHRLHSRNRMRAGDMLAAQNTAGPGAGAIAGGQLGA